MMDGYPRAVLELESWFNPEKTCREYLVMPRRSAGFNCPRNSYHYVWTRSDGFYNCDAYGVQTSVIYGAFLQGTKKPLREARTLSSRRTSDPSSPIRSCFWLVFFLVHNIMTTISSLTRDFYAISLRACRAYAITEDISYGLRSLYLGIVTPFQPLYFLMRSNLVSEKKGLKKRR